jgi:Ca-activated chloride channel family protein
MRATTQFSNKMLTIPTGLKARSTTVYCLTILIGLFALVGCEKKITSIDGSTEDWDKAGITGYDEGGLRDGGGNYFAFDGGDWYPGGEEFGDLSYNGFVSTIDDNLSTFGVDVDAGSYTFGRKKINEGMLPPSASVRVEEYINYFNQDYNAPTDAPFAVTIDGIQSPFRADSLHILRIGIQGKTIDSIDRKPWNLTFLIDISGSMTSRLDLVKESLYILVDAMQSGDRISICTYAGSVGTVLLPTSLDEIDAAGIKGIIADLEAGGSTAMASGLQNAYDVNFTGTLTGGVNRIVVCSDGDANVGASDHESILELIQGYVDEGITLSTLGFGQGNYKDLMMEQLADNGNGNYYYIDSIDEAERLFTKELTSVMEVIAKDVKIQVEFNASRVERYRLIGYENRDIADDEFEDETTDAGEIGAGHRVTALYEVELKGGSGELAQVHLRYKLPGTSSDIAMNVPFHSSDLNQSSPRLIFTIAVAEFAEILRESPYVSTTLATVESLVAGSLSGSDEQDVELLELIRIAQIID